MASRIFSWARPWLAGGAVLATGGAALAVGSSAVSAAATCTAAGSTGLTAAVVVTSSVSRLKIDAQGCDVGIYVPPGTSGITISRVTVTGANDHGIFAQNATGITIANSKVESNGVAPTAGIAENKAIELVGTSDSMVVGNTVEGNYADGGIGIADDGSVDPGAPDPGMLAPSADDTVAHNMVMGNYVGCGIVFAAYDPGAGILGGNIVGNTDLGKVGFFSSFGPVVGGVVVAADSPGTTVTGVVVADNHISQSFIPGIVIHSNAPGDHVSSVKVVNNTLTGDGWGEVDDPAAVGHAMVGVVVATGSAPQTYLEGTLLVANRISDEDYGIVISGATGTRVVADQFNRATTPVSGLD